MKLDVLRYTSMLSVSIALAACGGAQSALPSQNGPSSAAESQWMLTPRPACGRAPAGSAQCLVLLINTHVQPAVAGWTPADFQARYKLPSNTRGAGQIVAVVDAYDNPNVASDLAAYRSQFELGSGTFEKYNQKGQTGNYPTANTGWGIESDLDTEMVAATCPLCTIYLVEANSSAGSDLEAAEAEAVKLGAHVVTNSWTCDASNCVDQSYFNAKHVEYLAALGDGGSNEFGAPAVFADVAAIGGTMLSRKGSEYSESVWSDSGGGCDTAVAKPSWQHDDVCSGRALGDASAVAWNVAEYDSYGYAGWMTIGGTSVAAPLLAGVFGLAGNAARQDGGRTFWQRAHRRDLYNLCGSACLFSQYSYGGGWGSPNGIGAF
jgi:subtilase family serine protease